jgi:hypothetical protein
MGNCCQLKSKKQTDNFAVKGSHKETHVNLHYSEKASSVKINAGL